MPIDYSEYHPKWSLISRLIRFKRANNKCEECGLKNGSIIDKETREYPVHQKWVEFHQQLYTPHSSWTYPKLLKHFGFTKIVLTVAHLDHDKENNRFWNLKALCQKCHLEYDKSHHINNRRFGRNWKKNQTKLEL